MSLLDSQLNLDANAFRSKSIGEVRETIKRVHKQSSANVLRHLEAKFDVRSFAL